MEDIENTVIPEVVDDFEENEDTTITNITLDNDIVQSNALVEGCYSLNDVEQRVLFALIAAIDQNDKSLKKKTVRIKNIAAMCNINIKNAYRQIDEVCDKLVTKAVIYKTKDRNGKKESVRHPWFSQLDNKEVNGSIVYQFHKSLSNELIELRKLNSGWVSIKQGIVNKLETSPAIRFYILFLKWLKIGHLSLTIEQIVKMFDLNGKYIDKRTKKLNKSLLLQRVVFPALERINKETGLKVGYEIQKVGKSTTGITFRFRLNEEKPPVEINVPPLEENKEWRKKQTVANACNRLKSNGFKESLFNQILEKFDNEDDFQNSVSIALDELTSAMVASSISNPGGFLYKKIMEYDPEQQKMFAAESAAEKQKEMERIKKHTESISNATSWEEIIKLAKSQSNIADATKILREASSSKSNLYESYKSAYSLTYPNDGGYDVDLEIARLTGEAGVNELTDKTVNYELKPAPSTAVHSLEELKARLAQKKSM